MSYTGYECNVIGFNSDLKSMEKIPVSTAVMEFDNPLSGTMVRIVFNQAHFSLEAAYDNP